MVYLLSKYHIGDIFAVYHVVFRLNTQQKFFAGGQQWLGVRNTS